MSDLPELEPQDDHVAYVTSQLALAAQLEDADTYERYREELLGIVRSTGANQDTSAVIAAIDAIRLGDSEEMTGQAGVRLLHELYYLANPEDRPK